MSEEEIVHYGKPFSVLTPSMVTNCLFTLCKRDSVKIVTELSYRKDMKLISMMN